MEKVAQSGARGATIGRNIWGAEDPAFALAAFQAVLHDGLGEGSVAPVPNYVKQSPRDA
jgi:class I fructose-bisphosphate aldolase